MIEVRDLSHRYGRLTAVQDLAFSVRRGEILGLLGPNGAGKTTTLRAVVGLLSPTRGQISIGGNDLRERPLAARRLLGYLPESVPLYRELRVTEFLRFAVQAKGVPRSRCREEVDRLVEACALQTVASRLIGFCSRGYRQRIGLAQALAGDPPALVLDEPTVGLDPGQVVEIRQRIAGLAREKAVILSTHVLAEASLLCTRVLILNRGKRLAEDRPDNLSRALSNAPRVRVVCRASDAAVAAVRALPEVKNLSETDAGRGVTPGMRVLELDLAGEGSAAGVARALVAAGADIEELRPERLGLEDVFLELVRAQNADTAGDPA